VTHLFVMGSYPGWPLRRRAGRVRADDLGAAACAAGRYPQLDPERIDDVIFGCANQAGEDNRNVAHVDAAGRAAADGPAPPLTACAAPGLDAIGFAARAIKAGDGDLLIAGGVESMSRAPFVMGKATAAFQRQAEMFDTTIGWRFVNPLMHQQFGTDSMPETAENVAELLNISRADQDAFAQPAAYGAGAAERHSGAGDRAGAGAGKKGR
jgi:3-oxo-5,6-didehydrosuberyl-CoA/3-oxoadipyl-CoA thiolase